MNEQYKYILDNPPAQVGYGESFKGLKMIPFQDGSPIPTRMILSKEFVF